MHRSYIFQKGSGSLTFFILLLVVFLEIMLAAKQLSGHRIRWKLEQSNLVRCLNEISYISYVFGMRTQKKFLRLEHIVDHYKDDDYGI